MFVNDCYLKSSKPFYEPTLSFFIFVTLYYTFVKYVLKCVPDFELYCPKIIILSINNCVLQAKNVLMFQVAIGIGLIWNALYNVRDAKEICIANKINNWCVIGIFLVVVINVFVSSFGVADPPTLPTAPVLAVPSG